MPNVPCDSSKTLEQVGWFLRPMVEEILKTGAAEDVPTAVRLATRFAMFGIMPEKK